MEILYYQMIMGVDTFLNILSLALIIYAVMTWFLPPNNKIYRFFARIADFVISPFRPVSAWLISRGLRFDVSIILALFCIRMIRNLLYRLVW